MSNLSEHARQLPLRLIQLDDGFQRAVGDWLDINDKFSPSLRGLASDIRVAGFMPGLWLAPFLLSANSRTYAEHPDWVIRDARGEPVNALHNWGSANYCLDTTHPAAFDWICEVIRIVTEDWGFDYLKLDFLYAAAVRGIRHDPSVTSVQAYRAAMRRIREVVGERFILGCGAPLLPSIGLVDGMRIGSDVAGYWGHEGNSDGPALSNALRATLARGWLHGKWWTNDPDCVIVRGHDTELTPDEVQAWAAVVALSGGMFFVGDDLSELEPDRLAILSRLVPPSGVAASASAPVFQRIPQRVHLRFRGRSVVGIANWGDTPTPSAFDPTEFDLPLGIVYHLFDLWRGDYLGRTPAPRRLPDLPPHALHLLAVHADEGHPRVVGTTGHLLGPAMDVSHEAWDPARGELVVTPTTNGPKNRAAEIVVADSSGRSWRLPFAPARPEPIHFSCE
jgi:alpha-galactosidase